MAKWCLRDDALLMQGLLVAALTGAGSGALAQDAKRGAALYMQLPGGVASCVSCHGPEPQGNRNSLLKAAGNAQALTQALATVGVMSYLRASLDDAGIADLAAFLGSVNSASSTQVALTLWPLTADFGTLGVGSAGGPQRVQVFNRGSQALRLSALRVEGKGITLRHDCPDVLAAGARCTASLGLLALTAGQVAGAFEVTSPDLAAPLVVALVSVVQPVAGGVLSWSPDPGVLDFSAVAAGETATRNLTLINGGTAPVTLGAAPQVFGSLTLTGNNLTPVTLNGCAAGTLLAPAASCQLSVRYAAGSGVGTQAVLQVRSNGANPAAVMIVAADRPAAAPIAEPAGVPVGQASGGAAGAGQAGALFWLGLVLASVPLWRQRLKRPHGRCASGPRPTRVQQRSRCPRSSR